VIRRAGPPAEARVPRRCQAARPGSGWHRASDWHCPGRPVTIITVTVTVPR
jgi:hypothetical protein